jgi:SAM-dependent methyltransferase
VNPDEVRRRWAERSGEFSPDYYAHYGPDETSDRLLDVLDSTVGRDASVLELGCSAGRHLAHLARHGYERLHGVDINEEAFAVLRESYPELADVGTFHARAIEDVLPQFRDDRFDAVYTVETLQHIHPDDEWVFADVLRVASDLVVTVENEGPHGAEDGDVASDAERPPVNYVNDDFPLYYRDWDAVFTGLGLTAGRVEATDRDTLRAFHAHER